MDGCWVCNADCIAANPPPPHCPVRDGSHSRGCPDFSGPPSRPDAGMLMRLWLQGWIVCEPGCVPMPRNREEAQAMNVLSERHLRDNPPAQGDPHAP